jgi:hypothetical protein
VSVIIPNRRMERRGTAAAAATLNEVLLAGEWFIETDTRKVKVGNGVTAYNSLPYVGELANLGNPAGDRLVYWDDTAGQFAFLALGTGLAIGSGGDLDATGGGGGGGQASIQFEDEGSSLGASGTVDTVDFVGAGVSAARVGNVVTVTIAGGGGSTAAGTSISDAGGYYTGTNVEDALQEVGADLRAFGITTGAISWDAGNTSADMTISGGGLTITKSAAGSAHRLARANISLVGKRYFEVRVNTDTVGNRLYFIGVSDPDDALTNFVGQSATSVGMYGNAGEVYRSGGSAGSFGSYTAGDIIGVAYDSISGKIYFAKNNTWINSGNPSEDKGRVLADNPGGLRPAVSIYEGSSGVSLTARFKASDFSYSAPTGFSPVDSN